MDLAKKRCVPCESATMPFFKAKAAEFLKEISGWELSDDAKSISKEYRFKDFAEALAFTNAVGAIAEAEGHHPDLLLSWGRVRVSLTTHNISGLSENDFILAAKIDSVG